MAAQPPRNVSSYPPPTLGPIAQVAYLVGDLDVAVRYWVEHFGVGPFFVQKHLKFTELVVNGAPSDVDFSIALAWGGGVQIELIEQHNQAPSVFRGFPYGAIHHVGIRTMRLAEDAARLRTAGMREVQRGVATSGTVTAFFDGNPVCGIVELIQPADGGTLLEKMKKAASEWDGKSLYGI
ncbi:VOC family protein [Mesorhizobium sp. CU2]|uniref:VOC family protein n=1 Tax=unclassified Mesorhizobium TaxID=325217 RepID=UPI00112E0049|nr:MULTISPECIES: VOC family protein [unclassified Mesorhizobium]TPN81116.1 VOC family protein [Mesorhizobium sp. CU3]TPO17086.1 VOC family protein [Mesorhizobium sp. CU2]